MRNKFKTFLEPALADKKVLLFTILTWIVIQSFFFINIFLIQKVVEIIES
jgi:hypothetical protein